MCVLTLTLSPLYSRIESELTPLPDVYDSEALGVDKDRVVNSPWIYRKLPVRYVIFVTCCAVMEVTLEMTTVMYDT